MNVNLFHSVRYRMFQVECATWTVTKRLKRKLDSNYTRMLRAISISPGGNTPQGTNYTATSLPSRKLSKLDEPDTQDTAEETHKWCTPMDLWTPTYGRAKAGRPARTYIQQLCEDTGCSPEDPPEAMNDREKWRVRVRDIRSCDTTWWWYKIDDYSWGWPKGCLFNSYNTEV